MRYGFLSPFLKPQVLFTTNEPQSYVFGGRNHPLHINSQRTILQQYAKEQGLHVVGEYVDDGWSGTNFERPDFQRMMDDMEAGKVNCIVTKDLSRFGREHVMMDYYLEFLFPEKRVRYIAVAENEDTEKGLSDFVTFKNLLNATLS